MSNICDLTILKDGDTAYYPYYEEEKGGWFLEQGVAEESGTYTDGVFVTGEGWRQYVSKSNICKVLRGEEVIFIDNDVCKDAGL